MSLEASAEVHRQVRSHNMKIRIKVNKIKLSRKYIMKYVCLFNPYFSGFQPWLRRSVPRPWKGLRRRCGGGELYVVHSVRTGALWLSALCSGHGRHLRPGRHLLYSSAHLQRVWSGRGGRGWKTEKEEKGGLVFFVPCLLKCCVFLFIKYKVITRYFFFSGQE